MVTRKGMDDDVLLTHPHTLSLSLSLAHTQLEDFVYITDNTYTGAQVRQMERVVLETIDYNLATPAPIHFLRRFSKVAKVMTHPLPEEVLKGCQGNGGGLTQHRKKQNVETR